MKHSRHKAATSNPADFAPGQRWSSETQPELGLALIVTADANRVQAHFPATGETMTYASRSAPLRRVAFESGDTVERHGGEKFVVDAVRNDEGRLIYIDKDGGELPESELSDTLSVQRADARLLGGHTDDTHTYRLRQAALRERYRARSRRVRGLSGARISLIPHQLFIASEVASRYAPRVLLADEVGLGKTIEACLILHRLHLSGRARRILILVPDALVNQWFVELFRRFQMSFAIFDEARAASIEAGEGGSDNPFFDDQLVLCATSWLADNPRRAEQAAKGGWDLAIVDEAHHLEWTPEKASPAYEAVAAIAEASSGLLLLTATPEQLGRAGHFARLRLLDPDRFSNLEEFIEESEHYQEVSALADVLRSGASLAADDEALLNKLLGTGTAAELAKKDTEKKRNKLCAALVDLHGTGRVMFRNRRVVLEGFPQRIAHLEPMAAKEDTAKGRMETKCDWVVEMMRSEPEERFLLICHSQEMAVSIEAALRERIASTAALFHEGLTLLERDRNAAWFAEENGARILICSEIGSEGRNFQFAHHLVLFDLPDDPALLEQRIGRLDRIGQEEDIHIHVPFINGSAEELWALWYQKGVNAFEQTLHGASAIYREFHDELGRRIENGAWEEPLGDLLERTQAFKVKIDRELEEGRDHLLEISSFDRDLGEELVAEIDEVDEDVQLERLMLRLFDHFGVTVEDLDARTFYLSPEHLFSTEAFPGLGDEGMTVTFDRDTALAREEIVFLSWDHPMVSSAIEMLLSSERGNAAFARIDGSVEKALLLEVVCVLECIAPEKLHADRFLPTQPISLLVDQQGKEPTTAFEAEMLKRAAAGPVEWLRKKAAPLRAVLPIMLDAGEALAETRADAIRKVATKVMTKQLDGEIERLEKLRELGHPVRESEIELATSERDQLVEYLGKARLRIDSVRLILAVPAK